MPETKSQICSTDQDFQTSKKRAPILLYCILCSSIALVSEARTALTPVRPLSYKFTNEIDLMEMSFTVGNYNRKKEYLKIRQKIIREMKMISMKYSLENQTFFLSVAYLDKICEKINLFNYDEIKGVSVFCLILASKFYETSCVGMQIENDYKDKLSSNYKSDEIYILQLLDYKLNIVTVYDILNQIKSVGFVFQRENLPQKKVNVLYSQVDKMVMAFIENKSFIDFTPKQVAFAIIGFLRGTFNLESFSLPLKLVYNLNTNNFDDLYLDGFNRIKNCFRIKKDNKHQRI